MHSKIKCIIVDDEPVARDVLDKLLSKIDSVEVLAKCKNAVEAFNEINKHSIDLIFLDINMPEISGLSFAKSINSEVKIIFTTAYREYAVEGFDLQAVDYLLKPISFERLLQSVNRLLSERNVIFKDETKAVSSINDHIFVRSDRKMIKVPFSEIQYVESVGDYVKIYMDSRKVVTRETISSIEAKLPKIDFLRIHRSFIVAVKRIESYTNETIDIKDKELPVSRSYKDKVIAVLSKE